MPFKITSVMALATLVGAAAAAASRPMTTNEDPAGARRLTESFEFIDCYEDGPSPRIMGNPAVSAPGVMTTEMCASNCAGSSYFGTQYSHECFCGDENTVFEYYGTSSDCIMPCDGDSADICGGVWAMSVYEYTDLSGLPATPVPTPVPVPTLPPADIAPTPEPIVEPPTGVPPVEPIVEPLEDDDSTDATASDVAGEAYN